MGEKGVLAVNVANAGAASYRKHNLALHAQFSAAPASVMPCALRAGTWLVSARLMSHFRSTEDKDCCEFVPLRRIS